VYGLGGFWPKIERSAPRTIIAVVPLSFETDVRPTGVFRRSAVSTECATFDPAQGHHALKPQGFIYVRDVDQAQMDSMGMDGARSHRQSHHVWARDLSLRSKAPRSQCPILTIADDQQNMRAAPALRESMSRSFVAISTDARSALIQESQRFVYLGQEALDFVALMLAGPFL
jgi:hypothetical protein